MIVDSNQQREEAANVDLSFANLSRKCSNCGQTGHNSRTCLESRDVAISEAEYKSSVGDSVNTNAPAFKAEKVDKRTREEEDAEVSDCSGTITRDVKKKGLAWTEEEHKLFLQGLQKLGKGDWRGISRQFVQTRSPTQVASHAQKYFIRQSVAGKRKRRSSLFDLIPEGVPEVKSQVAGAVSDPHQGPKLPKSQPSPGQPQQGFSYPPAPIQGPQALAFTYWYQNLLMQQGSMAWLQAMYAAQSANNCFTSSNNPFPGPGCTKTQGFPIMSEDAMKSMRDGQMAANLALQQQAAVFLAQQQISAAVSMGPPPFGSAAAGQGTSGVSCKSAAPEMSHSGSAYATERSDNGLASMPSETTRPSAAPVNDAKSNNMQTAKPFPPAELFGNGKLVRPRAQRAQSTQTLGTLPNYMLPSQHEATLASSSKDSGETRALLSSCGVQAEASLYSVDPRASMGFQPSACHEKSIASEGSRTLRFAAE